MVSLFLQITALLLLAIFTFLSGLHFYWAMGGKRWGNVVVPEIKGKASFKPGVVATLVVAIGLLGFGALAILLAFTDTLEETPAILYAGWIASGIFLIRAIGDFRYVGFFKSMKKSGFARNDTRIYSPLCLFLALSFAFLTY